MSQRLFHPQFHGREHLNVNRWMRFLQTNQGRSRFAFDKETTFSGEVDYNFMEALDYDHKNELREQANILTDGLQI